MSAVAILKERGALASGMLYGFLLWALSPWIFGGLEPWDGDRNWLYFLALAFGGFFHAAFFRVGPGGAFWSVLAGQAGFLLYQRLAGSSVQIANVLLLAPTGFLVLLGAGLAKILVTLEGKKKDDGTTHPL
jgi:hypothetical protein